jgi:hypothetical protein
MPIKAQIIGNEPDTFGPMLSSYDAGVIFRFGASLTA